MFDICPDCEQGKLVKETVNYEFQYGSDANHVMLKTEHPIYKCDKCGSAVCGEEGEIARDKAVNDYLLTKGK